MALSSFLPSATSTLANSAPWFNAFFAEFQIYLYIGVGVLGAILMINFLKNNFLRVFYGLRMDWAERDPTGKSRANLINNINWETWKAYEIYNGKDAQEERKNWRN